MMLIFFSGVILLTNKKDNSHFTAMDDGTYQIFATYCSLVLHHYRIKKQLYQAVSTEILVMNVLSLSYVHYSILIKNTILCLRKEGDP